MREMLHYDPETGIFIWRKHPYKGRAAVGDRAGSPNPVTGYRFIGIDGEVYAEHQMAWLYFHGTVPESILDHVNGEPADNRIANLRYATASQNNANRRRHKSNKSGFKGVSASGFGGFMAQAKKDKKQYYFGTFKTAEEAHAAYVAGVAALHGEFARAA